MASVKAEAVLVALSGGIDSALAAALLKREGREVRGLHFLLPGLPEGREKKARVVRELADHLEIPVAVLDLRDVFSLRIIEPFIASYLKGSTPNPCVLCNQIIKFDSLLQWADREGIPYVATGHYARIARGEGHEAALFRGRDRGKDQTYFLHRLTQAQLCRTLLPLGEMTKQEVRETAAEMGLPTRKEPESQEICFLPGNDYRAFLEEREGDGIRRRGDILNREGEKVGEHRGTYRYTMGQRHGLGIASSRPYYVMDLRVEENQVIVGRREALYSRRVEAVDFNWIDGRIPPERIRVFAQVRYRHRAAPGWLQPLSGDRVGLEFDRPQWAVTPGQALVCYEEERLLGGGWIERGDGGMGEGLL
ncbi:MAG: tRNA 2-thiouridine(34) synthase MnmA [Deltaproteobacteria bacterium]|nr:tRNA 2-thiouridine(34) synthase MnmA [Deltaproteobacteria bacterium]